MITVIKRNSSQRLAILLDFCDVVYYGWSGGLNIELVMHARNSELWIVNYCIFISDPDPALTLNSYQDSNPAGLKEYTGY